MGGRWNERLRVSMVLVVLWPIRVDGSWVCLDLGLVVGGVVVWMMTVTIRDVVGDGVAIVVSTTSTAAIAATAVAAWASVAWVVCIGVQVVHVEVPRMNTIRLTIVVMMALMVSRVV